MTDSHLHDTRPELALATEVLERISTSGWGITGQDVITTINGQSYSIDRRLSFYKANNSKAELLFEVHGNHDWTDIPKSDVKKTLALLSQNNLMNIYLKADQIKKWAEQIIFYVEEAMGQAAAGKKVYRSIYQHKKVLHCTRRLGEF